MKKIKIQYSVISEDGCPSRSYQHELPYFGYFQDLVNDLSSAVELFELRQEKYRQKCIKDYGIDPFEEKKDE